MRIRRAKPVPYTKLQQIAELLKLDRAWIRIDMLGTDIDVLGLRRVGDDFATYAVEVKATLHEKNAFHAIRQLDFRANFFNYVYLAVPSTDVYYALMIVPLEYGVIDLSNMTVVRKSKRFEGHFHRFMKMYLVDRW